MNKTKTSIYILPKLNKLPKVYCAWQNLLKTYADSIKEHVVVGDYANAEEELEAEVIRKVVGATVSYGMFSGEVVDHYSDLGVEELDGALAEDIIHNLFGGVSVSGDSDDGAGVYLDCDLYSLIYELRQHLYRCIKINRFYKSGTNLGMLIIHELKPLVPDPNGDWLVQVGYTFNDTRLLIAPTIDEFKTLMFYWQKKYGALVGHADSEKAIDLGATYIGRQTAKYAGSGLTIPDVSMGNPYSHLYSKEFKYIDQDGVVQFMEIKGRLEACFAYYLKTINDLINDGNGDDSNASIRHWVRFLNLFQKELACHCSNFSDRKAESRFCHGLVIAAISEVTTGSFDVAV